MLDARDHGPSDGPARPRRRRVRHRRVRMLVAAVAVLLPSRLSRAVHVRLLGHDIDPTARIGHSFIDVDHLTMGPSASIGHLNVIRGPERVVMGRSALILHLVWVSSVRRERGFFVGLPRDPALVMDDHAKIMMMHFLDCCDLVHLGERASLAGFWSLVMTHSVDHENNRQGTAPIRIGRRALVATRVTLLPGATVADRCIVAAGATITGELSTPNTLYGGTPARAIRELDPNSAFFQRTGTVLR